MPNPKFEGPQDGPITVDQFREALRIINNLANYKPSAIAAALEVDAQTAQEISDAYDEPGTITTIGLLWVQRESSIKALIHWMTERRPS